MALERERFVEGVLGGSLDLILLGRSYLRNDVSHWSQVLLNDWLVKVPLLTLFIAMLGCIHLLSLSWQHAYGQSGFNTRQRFVPN